MGARRQEVYDPLVAASAYCHMEALMTSHLEHEQLLAHLEDALAEAERIGSTLAAAMIADCIAALERTSSPNLL